MPSKQQFAGKLISFEGSEGSGKSTQIARLAAHFQKTHREVLTTREPGGTPRLVDSFQKRERERKKLQHRRDKA